jgi:hypothetical protein
MKKYIASILLLCAIALFSVLHFYSCTKVEDVVEFPVKEKTLVLHCYFSQDSAWLFFVSRSLSVIDNAELKYVTDATVKLFEEDELKATLTSITYDPETNIPFYRFEGLNPQVGKKYKVEVSHPDYPTIYASDVLTTPVNLIIENSKIIDSSLFYDPWLQKSIGNMTASITISVDDPAKQDNYYLLYMYYIDSSEYAVYKTKIYSYETNNPAVDKKYDNGLLFTDYLFDGKKYEITFKIDDWSFYSGKKYYFVLESMSRARFYYEKSTRLYYNMQYDPFSEPIQIFNNIENGYGIFAGFSNSVKVYSF